MAVRELRRALATALAEEGRDKEALEQLTAALAERGESPAAADLHLASGRLHEKLGDAAQALDAYVHAVTQDPASDAAAAAALRLLDTVPELAIGSAMAGAVQSAAAEIARPAPTTLVLAGRLLRRVGDLGGASAAFERALAGELVGATAVADELVDVLLESGRLADARRAADQHQACSRETECWLLLEERRFEKALDLAEQDLAGPLTERPGRSWAEAARLLALTALGRLGDRDLDAEREAELAVIQFARLVALLARQGYATAQKAGEELARSVGAEPIALAIRAQVLLEMAGDADAPVDGYAPVEEARRLLERLRHVGQAGRPDSGAAVLAHRWIRVQRAVRADDDRFQYALAEATVALDSDGSRRRAAVAGCRLVYTTGLQDAAVRELAVEVLDPELDGPGEQAAACFAAARALDDCGETARARGPAERAVQLAPTLDSRCDLADMTWRLSFSDATDKPARLEQLQTTLRLLNEEGPVPADAGSRPAYMRGLLLARLAELSGGELGWQSLPYLLAAALAVDDGYRWANLSRALSSVNVRVSALACAERAVALLPDDAYVTETYLVAEVTHLADPGLTAQAIARFPENDRNGPWFTSVQLVTALTNGREQEVRDLLARPQAADVWARWTVLQAEVLAGRMAPGSGELASFAAGLESDADNQDTLAEVRRVMGQYDAADDAIARAEREATPIPARRAVRERAQTALLRDPSGDGEATQAELLRTDISPSNLLEAIHVDLPLFEMLVPAVRPAAARLRRVAESRLAELKRFPPKMTEDFALADNRSSRAALTRHLLGLAEPWFSGDWASLAERLDGLDTGTDATGEDDFLPAALDEARRQVACRIVRAVTPQLLDRSLAGDDVDHWAGRVERWSTLLDEDDLRRARVALWWAARDGDRRQAYRAAISDEASASAAAEQLAVRFVSLATGGDMASAREAYLAGTAFAGGPAFGDLVATAMTSAGDYAPTIAGLDAVGPDAAAAPEVRRDLAATRDRVIARLEELLGLRPPETAAEAPTVIPVRVDLGTGLVPLVDPAQDGNVFLGRLVPRLKDRVYATTGVRLPGIRLRPNEALDPDQFVLEVDEVPAARRSVPPDGEFVVRAAGPADLPSAGGLAAGDWPFLTRFHPLTGEIGFWAITAVDGKQPDGQDPDAARPAGEQPGEPAEEQVRLSSAQLLAHAIELALRPRLARFLGLQEVSDLVDRWSSIEDPDEIAAVVPDLDARLALTWVLQATVDDGLSIAPWRDVLGAIRGAGGLGAPVRTLADAIRARQPRELLEAPGLPRVRIPAEIERAVVDGMATAADRQGLSGQARHQLMTWVRQHAAEHGPLLALVTSGPAARAAISEIVRGEFEFTQTLCEPEAAS